MNKCASIHFFFCLLFICAPPSLQARDKTDVILMKNGDTITGEIKRLDRGRLELSTSYMGTVKIEWDDVQQVTSAYDFELEDQAGVQYFGKIEEDSRERRLQVRGDQPSGELEHDDIIRITPIEGNFFQQIKGYLDVGFSITRANRSKQFSLNAEAIYRKRSSEARVTYSSLQSDQENTESSTRNNVGIQFNRLLKNRYFVAGLSSFTQNEELGLSLRSLFGAGFGRFLIQSNRTIFSVLGGASVARERFTLSDETTSNAEALGGFRLSTFRFDDPEVDLTTSVFFIPSLTEPGRYRLELESRLRYEVFKDLFFGINIFDSFDSRPPVVGLERNDFGVSTSIGWSF